MAILKTATILILPLLAGCIVAGYDEPRSSAPPLGEEPILVVASEDEEVHYVVYREYFGCSEEEFALFPHYRRYYGLTDDDFYFIYFTSRQAGIAFDDCFHSYYYDCGRSYDRLVVHYRIPRERYFVAIGAGVAPPPMYARTYASHRSGNYSGVTFTNQEYVALVHLKVGVEYQGHPPAAYFARVQSTGSSGRVILESRDQSGRGGRSATGAGIQATATRPWTLAAPQKQQWHQERRQTSVRTEGRFKESHKDQVTKVERQGPPPRPAAQDPGQKPPQRHPASPPQQSQAQEPRRPPSGPAEPPPPRRPVEEPQERRKDGDKPKGGDEKDDKRDKGEKKDR